MRPAGGMEGMQALTGGYVPAKLKRAWMINIFMLVCACGLLLWDFMSYWGSIPFGAIVAQMFLGELVGLASALGMPMLVKDSLRVLYELSLIHI